MRCPSHLSVELVLWKKIGEAAPQPRAQYNKVGHGLSQNCSAVIASKSEQKAASSGWLGVGASQTGRFGLGGLGKVARTVIKAKLLLSKFRLHDFYLNTTV